MYKQNQDKLRPYIFTYYERIYNPFALIVQNQFVTHMTLINWFYLYLVSSIYVWAASMVRLCLVNVL